MSVVETVLKDQPTNSDSLVILDTLTHLPKKKKIKVVKSRGNLYQNFSLSLNYLCVNYGGIFLPRDAR